MKNLINKVLVVLAMSALIAGNVDAMSGQKVIRRRSATTVSKVQRSSSAQVDQEGTRALSIVEIARRIKENGINPINKDYSTKLRRQDLQALKDANVVSEDESKIIENFLVATAKGNTPELRKHYKGQAEKILDTVLAKESEKQTTKIKDATEQVQGNPTPQNIEVVQKEISYLSKMYGYLPTAKQAAAVTAIGAAVAALASIGYDYSQGAALGSTALSAGQATYSAVKGSPTAIWDGGKWVVGKSVAAGKAVGSAVLNTPNWVKGMAGSYVGGLLGRGTQEAITSTTQTPEIPVVPSTGEYNIPEYR